MHLGSSSPPQPPHDQQRVRWSVRAFPGLHQADVYLAPAVADARAATRALHELTGAVRVLPLYAFGFLACRWGWADRSYIETTLQTFRDGKYPLDAFISDFEWYTKEPDYDLPQEGTADFEDFGFNDVLFPEPAAQLADYHTRLGVRFGGIRKPRLGNADSLVMARANNWTIEANPISGLRGCYIYIYRPELHMRLRAHPTRFSRTEAFA